MVLCGACVPETRRYNKGLSIRIRYWEPMGVCSSILCSAVSFSGSVHEAHTELRFCDSLYEYS